MGDVTEWCAVRRQQLESKKEAIVSLSLSHLSKEGEKEVHHGRLSFIVFVRLRWMPGR